MFENDPIKAQDGGLAIAVFSELKGDLTSVFNWNELGWGEID